MGELDAMGGCGSMAARQGTCPTLAQPAMHSRLRVSAVAETNLGMGGSRTVNDTIVPRPSGNGPAMGREWARTLLRDITTDRRLIGMPGANRSAQHLLDFRPWKKTLSRQGAKFAKVFQCVIGVGSATQRTISQLRLP
jgi:hypothetical protein